VIFAYVLMPLQDAACGPIKHQEMGQLILYLFYTLGLINALVVAFVVVFGACKGARRFYYKQKWQKRVKSMRRASKKKIMIELDTGVANEPRRPKIARKEEIASFQKQDESES